MKINFILVIFFSVILSSCVGVSSKGLFGTGVSVAFDPRSVGTQMDDSIMQKNLTAKILIQNRKFRVYSYSIKLLTLFDYII